MNILGITNVRPLPPAIGTNVRPARNHCGSAATLGTHTGKMVPFRWKLLATARRQSMSRECTAHEIDKLTTTTDLAPYRLRR